MSGNARILPNLDARCCPPCRPETFYHPYRYLKGPDPGNWLSIDPETAEITLTKIPDRESPYLINGTYFANVLCISEGMFLNLCEKSGSTTQAYIDSDLQ